MTADAPRWSPVAPADRPRKTRRAVRVILSDEAGRVLLFQDSDPGLDPADPAARWWMTPGGGIDSEETLSQTAVRELREETGLVLAEDELVGPIARRTVRHGYSDQITEQTEWFFLVTVPHFVLDLGGHTEDEQLTVLRHHWWDVSALGATRETVWPTDILAVQALGDRPDRWPVDLGTVEESSVPL
ncbi:MAG: NUDIX domain-containing protein [Nakamurella sp.]